MPRICWSSLNRRLAHIIIGAAIAAAPAAMADEGVPFCWLPRAAPQSEEVAASWPRVVKNAFDPDGTASGKLSITMLISITRADASLCLAPYLIEDLVRSADGEIAGKIVPTNKDYPVFFYDEIAVDPQMVIDWQYVPDGYTVRFGNFATRGQLDDAPNEAFIALGLSPVPIPPEWN